MQTLFHRTHECHALTTGLLPDGTIACWVTFLPESKISLVTQRISVYILIFRQHSIHILMLRELQTGSSARLVAVTVTFCCLTATPARAACWEAAGEAYAVDPLLLKAIAWKESRGWTNAVGPGLPDGNRALGLMQINTIHLPALRKAGIQREDLFDACTSQRVGAWVLADCIRRFGATWKAVGCYYAGPASKNTRAQTDYVVDVQRFYDGYHRQQQLASSLNAGEVSAPTRE